MCISQYKQHSEQESQELVKSLKMLFLQIIIYLIRFCRKILTERLMISIFLDKKSTFKLTQKQVFKIPDLSVCGHLRIRRPPLTRCTKPTKYWRCIVHPSLVSSCLIMNVALSLNNLFDSTSVMYP